MDTVVREIVIEMACWIERFVEQDILPDVIQTSGIALLTIIVAVAIFLVEKGSVFEFDRQVILKYVIRAKKFLVSVALVFAPLFLWNATSYSVKLLLFLISLSGFYLLIRRLRCAYKWMYVFESDENYGVQTYRMRLRLKYIESIENAKEKIAVWSYIWRIPNKSISEEIEYTKAFAKYTDDLIKEGDDRSLDLAVKSFEQLTWTERNHISFGNLAIFRILFMSVLQNYRQVSTAEPGEVSSCSCHTQLKSTLKRVIGFLVKKSLRHELAYYVFFQILKKHLEENESDDQYSERVISNIANAFFENVSDSSEHIDVWRNFPREWKVTKQTVEDSKNVIVWIWLNEFIDWAQRRIAALTPEGEVDNKLDEVSKTFFPEVDTVTWAIILTFYCQSFSNGQRMRTLVERPRKFGHFHGTHGGKKQTYMDKSQDKIDEEIKNAILNKIDEKRKNAIELSLLIFWSEFTKEKIEEYIKELDKLEYEKESWEAGRKNQIKWIFEDMLEYMRNENGSE